MSDTTSPTTPPLTPPPLTPMALGTLLGRIEHEWSSRKKIFDLPTARFWQPGDIDLSFEFLGRRCATPIGPAAGPHSQLAENIVLAWLGGSRLFELKTVQVLDDLDIGRPCIDMQTIGYNIEWSQELSVPVSLTEYVKASMLLDILRQWEPLTEFVGADPGPHVFDMSVGYDLAGISGEKVAAFIRGMRNATAEVEKLRPEIGGTFAEFRDFEFTTHLADTLTLSTFHGCPPDEIEAITKHLIDEHDLDVIVKLNPTLLGYETVAGIVNEELGYRDVSVKEQAFADDLQFDRGVELIGELNEYAKARGNRFGIKLTNTLVVDNHKGWMPDDTMYLSGPPLHVLASTLLDTLAQALPGVLAIPGSSPGAGGPGDGPGGAGDVMVSFSAGITKDNLAEAIAMGVNPATVCSDLLKPGGYGRLAPMLKALATEVGDAGHTDLTTWKAARQAEAEAAGFASSAARHVADIRGAGIGPYHFEGNEKLPREVDTTLEMFGCVACNFCVTVCPNDAFTNILSLDGMEGRQQYLVFAELCNECGNCLTFCPETGDPAMIKPRLYTDAEVFVGREGQGYLLDSNGTITEHRGPDGSVDLIQRLLDTQKGNPLTAGGASAGGGS
ncbi:MAG: 4Fe-4S dicluster domain-containing protein [Acidimicrobiales bacterium]|nr:4Fe-4S dicluster domain-containing protein [Acidimicrobiales bacterium]